MLLKIKVILRDPSNSKKYIGEVLKINLKKLFKVKTKKKIARRKTRRKFTTLKSPHAHKDAQTSFELVSYNYTFKLKANQVSKLLSYYKKICCRLIPDVKIKMILKINVSKDIQEKRGIIRHFNHFTCRNSLIDYLIELGFYGKDSFYPVSSDV
jgi:ribosomal protein S10